MGIKMDNQIIQRMTKEAMDELLHYYDKGAKQKLKDMLKKAAGRYVPPKDVIFWDTGLLANGLMELPQDTEILQAVRQYFNCWIEQGMSIYYVDDTLCGVALLRLYEATSDESYKQGADKLVNYLLTLGEKEADALGSIPYRPAQKNGHVYVDGIGMMCPFLTMYGVKYGNEKAVELALTQIRNMLDYGMDIRTGLPYHGFRYESREKYGIIGWGRAVGWLLMGMKGTLYWLQEGRKEAEGDIAQKYDAEYQQLKEAFVKLLEAVKPYQRADGGFSWQLEAMEGPADSSATAMIAQALQFAAACGYAVSGGTQDTAEAEDDKGKALQCAIRFLLESEKGGRIYCCLGECEGFSQYPQVYGAYPWSLGTTLEVLAHHVRSCL